MIDTSCTDPLYWEAVLAESNLSTEVEVSKVVEISAEEFQELSNLELLPEEDYERDDDPVITFNGITLDIDTLNADHSGLSETNEELRTKIDSDDTFFTGHRIIKMRRGNRPCPDWAIDDKKVRELLLRSFPKLATNHKQRASAGRWARLIQLYFKSQMTHGQAAAELGVNVNTVSMLIRSINRAAKGLRTDTSQKRTKSGRPRKCMT